MFVVRGELFLCLPHPSHDGTKNIVRIDVNNNVVPMVCPNLDSVMGVCEICSVFIVCCSDGFVPVVSFLYCPVSYAYKAVLSAFKFLQTMN
jgi:hypothetical protein